LGKVGIVIYMAHGRDHIPVKIYPAERGARIKDFDGERGRVTQKDEEFTAYGS
jgi:ribosomal protein S19